MSEKHFFEQKQLVPESLQEAYQQKFGVVDIETLAPNLENWFDSPLGSSLLRAEQEMLDKALGYLFGYHLLQLSVDRRAKLYEKSKINHCFGLHPIAANNDIYTGFSNYERLPLEKGSIDVAILHHVIDYAAKPHRLLREVVRAIAPHGHVVVVGFNPVSLLGVKRLVARHTSRHPYQRSHTLRMSRVIDWLRLLDCEPVRVERGFFRLPVNSSLVLNRTGWMETVGEKLINPFGGFYMVIARKEQGSMVPMKPQWQPVKVMSGFSVGKVASRMPESIALKSSNRIQH